MILALALGLAAAAHAPLQDSKADEEALQQALECRVYSDMAKSVYASEPGPRAINEKLHRYWFKRSEQLGAKMGATPDSVRFKSLLIPLEAESFKPVMLKCLDATPEKALR